MKKFILFRHGETEYNVKRIFQGQGLDSPLTPRGVRQVLELKEILKDKEIDMVYTSPLQRAISSAMLAFDKNTPIFIYPDLIEANLGAAEGLTKQEIKEKFADVWQFWYVPNEHMDVRFPGGESKQEIGNRIKKALEYIAKISPADVIGISTHSAAIRCFLMPLGREDIPMVNCQFFEVSYDGKEFKLL